MVAETVAVRIATDDALVKIAFEFSGASYVRIPTEGLKRFN